MNLAVRLVLFMCFLVFVLLWICWLDCIIYLIRLLFLTLSLHYSYALFHDNHTLFVTTFHDCYDCYDRSRASNNLPPN